MLDQLEKLKRRERIRQFLNSLALAPKRICKSLHHCALCNCPITAGEEYRDRGLDRRAHEFCFQAVSKDLQLTGK
jgi:hypothetical protein